MTMASSTTKPVEMVSAMSVRLLMLKPNMIHGGEGADERERHGDARDEGGGKRAQEDEDDADDEARW